MSALAKIFICYRRKNAEGFAGRINEHLTRYFGRSVVFKDVYGIEGGDHVRNVIEETIAQTAVLIVIIGEEWELAQHNDGALRLEDPNDYVRLEISGGLCRRPNCKVIPVLIGSRRDMPAKQSLPEEIRELSDLNPFCIRSDPDFGRDVGSLCRKIHELVPRRQQQLFLLSSSIGVIFVFVLLLAFALQGGDKSKQGTIISKVVVKQPKPDSDSDRFPWMFQKPPKGQDVPPLRTSHKILRFEGHEFRLVDPNFELRGIGEEVRFESGPFYLATCETSVAQFRRFGKVLALNDSDHDVEELPVTGLKARDYVNYCDWLSSQNVQTVLEFRLPTETEWEFAANKFSVGGDNAKAISKNDLRPVKDAVENKQFHFLYGNAAELCRADNGLMFLPKDVSDFASNPNQILGFRIAASARIGKTELRITNKTSWDLRLDCYHHKKHASGQLIVHKNQTRSTVEMHPGLNFCTVVFAIDEEPSREPYIIGWVDFGHARTTHASIESDGKDLEIKFDYLFETGK